MTNTEVFERALGLRAPEFVSRNIHFAQTVAFRAHFRHLNSPSSGIRLGARLREMQGRLCEASTMVAGRRCIAQYSPWKNSVAKGCVICFARAAQALLQTGSLHQTVCSAWDASRFRVIYPPGDFKGCNSGGKQRTVTIDSAG